MLRGRVELTIQAGDKSDTVRGRVNPAFRPGDPLIVRRAAAIARGAVIIDADRGASDLDRALVNELRRPDAAVALTFRETAEPVSGVLVVDPGEVWRRSPDDRIPAVDPGCCSPPDCEADCGSWPLDLDADLSCCSPLNQDAAALIDETLARGSRVALRAQLHCDPQAPAVVARAHDDGHAVLPACGLAPLAAALAVAGVPIGRLLIADGRARTGRLPAGTCRAALNVRGDRVAGWLLGADRGLVALEVATPREEYRPWRAGENIEVPGGRARTAIVVAACSDRPAQQLDPAIAALIDELLARGASSRDVVQALQRQAGLSRRAAYELVLAVDRRPHTTSVSRPEPRTSR